MAQAVVQKLLTDAGLGKQFKLDSAGTQANHAGEKPDSRAMSALKRRGYDASRLRSRKVAAKDFEQFDIIFAMDTDNLADLKRICPPEHTGKLKLFLAVLDTSSETEIPDPYYGNAEGFERVLDLCETGAKALVKHYASK